MEWKFLSILAFICQLTVTVHRGSVGGTSSSLTEEKAHRASVVMCHPDQTFFCVNLTHYSPCIHLDLSDLVNTSFVMSREEFYCGAERCCQVGAGSPCTYRCQRQSLDFGTPRLRWNFSRLKKKKRSKKVPLTSEEVDRLNRIVSVKSFIIRQKDLEEWDDYDLSDENNAVRWKPSYRTFCPLKRSSFNKFVIETCGKNYEFDNETANRITKMITTTIKPTTTESKLTTTTSLKTTTITKTTTRKSTTLKSTTKTTTKKSTTSVTAKPTTKTTTNKPVRKWTTQTFTRHATKKITLKNATRPHTRKPRPGHEKSKPTKKLITKSVKINKLNQTSSELLCNQTYEHKRTIVKGSCRVYMECRFEKKKYDWKIIHCKNNYFFDSGTSQCIKQRLADCNIANQGAQAGRGKRWNERIIHGL